MAARLNDAEDLHSQLNKREEENDEIHGLAAQESAKIKHMVWRRNVTFIMNQMWLN